MAVPQSSETMSILAPAEASGRERLWLTVAGVSLVVLGTGFWVVNGTQTFGELMLGAFSWCF